MPRARHVLPLLFLPASPFIASRFALAQPPSAPSTIKKPAEYAFRAPAPPPDPAQITAAELQTLTGGPTLVTWSGVDVSVDVAAKALFEAARLTETRFGQEDDKKTVSLDWKATPFWTAAAELELLSGKRWDGRYGNGLSFNSFSRGDGVGLDGKMAAQTPFITLIANSLQRTTTRTVSFGAKPLRQAEADQVRLTLSAYFDPKLQIQSTVMRAVKFFKPGENAPLEMPEDPFGNRYFGRSGSSPISEILTELPKGVPAGTTFSRISGVLHTVLVSATQPFNVPDLLATPKVAKTVGQDQYALQEVTSDGEQITLRVAATLGGDAPQNQFIYFTNTFANLKVRDGAGQELRPQGSSTRGGAKARAEFSYSLKNSKGEATTGPYSLEWPIVTQTRSLDVPFELRDVVTP